MSSARSVQNLMSTVFTHMSTVFTHTSTVFTHMSRVFTHMSTVFTHMSRVFTHMSTVFTHMSTVFARMSAILRSIDTRVAWVSIFNYYCIAFSITLYVTKIFSCPQMEHELFQRKATPLIVSMTCKEPR